MFKRRVIWFAVLLVFWILGFYPFQLGWPSRFNMAPDSKSIRFITTGVAENTGVELSGDGLRFASPGIALLPAPPAWLPGVIETSSMDVELRVAPAKARQWGPARIFTISRDPWLRNLTIAQKGSDLIVRVRTPETDMNGMPSYRVKDVFSMPGERHISLRIGRGSLEVLIDGEGALLARLPEAAFSRWSADYRLAFGNELTFDRPWLGDIYLATVALGGKTISYTAPGALDIPDRYGFEALRSVSINPFPVANFSELKSYIDWAVNFGGFFALGLFIVYMRKSSVLAAAVFCGVLSLSIEAGQFFFVGRSPAGADLILNVLGGSFGAWTGARYALWRG